MKNKNLIIAIIILALGYWIYSLIQTQNDLIDEKIYLELENIKLEAYKNSQETLNECLDKAIKKYKDNLELNSVESSNGEYRYWDSDAIARFTTDVFEKDRNFCLKLHK